MGAAWLCFEYMPLPVMVPKDQGKRMKRKTIKSEGAF
jgi:hypothetical protein